MYGPSVGRQRLSINSAPLRRTEGCGPQLQISGGPSSAATCTGTLAPTAQTYCTDSGLYILPPNRVLKAIWSQAAATPRPISHIPAVAAWWHTMTPAVTHNDTGCRYTDTQRVCDTIHRCARVSLLAVSADSCCLLPSRPWRARPWAIGGRRRPTVTRLGGGGTMLVRPVRSSRPSPGDRRASYVWRMSGLHSQTHTLHTRQTQSGKQAKVPQCRPTPVQHRSPAVLTTLLAAESTTRHIWQTAI